MHVLVAAVADHVGRGRCAGRMVFGQHRPVGHVAIRDLDQRVPGVAGKAAARVQSDRLRERGIDVDQAHRRVGRIRLRDAGTGEDHRHAGRFLVHRRLAPQPARAEVVAVVGRIEDAGVGFQSRGRYRAQDLADVVVEKGHQAEVGCERALQHRFVESFVVAQAAAHRIDERVNGALVARIHRRPRQRPARVEIVELRRCDQREVRRHEPHVQHPGLVAVARRLALEPAARGRGDVAVVAGVLGFARPGLGPELARAGTHRKLVAYEPQQVAHAVDDMQRQDLLVEAVAPRLGGLIVKLADRNAAVARRHQALTPARRIATIGDGVVPATGPVHVLAGGEAGARRHADRAVGIGGVEPGAAACQSIQVRRAHQLVAVAAERALVVLVGENADEVGRLHRAMRSYRHRRRARWPQR